MHFVITTFSASSTHSWNRSETLLAYEHLKCNFDGQLIYVFDTMGENDDVNIFENIIFEYLIYYLNVFSKKNIFF